MDILGIGPLELVLVLILALLIFGPEDLVSAGRKMGKFFNKVVKSETWMAVRSISREMRNLPNKLVREAELDELSKEIKNQTIVPPTKRPSESPSQVTDSGSPEKLKAWTSPPPSEEEGEAPGTPKKPESPNEDADEQPSE
ncbi:MAG: twin-arginine translocase TatA/TatE family subunit [Anaerolineales bacterium]|jgi:Sec-independent protein translocase protein TatA